MKAVVWIEKLVTCEARPLVEAEGMRWEPTLHRVLKGGMQVVHHLGEDIGWPLSALFIHEEQFHTPFSHGEVLDWRFVATRIHISQTQSLR